MRVNGGSPTKPLECRDLLLSWMWAGVLVVLAVVMGLAA